MPFTDRPVGLTVTAVNPISQKPDRQFCRRQIDFCYTSLLGTKYMLILEPSGATSLNNERKPHVGNLSFNRL
jgi:hypothetical protein